MSDEVPDAGEMYWDKVQGRMRRRRGSRKRSHGPMSTDEKNMSRAFQGMLIREMHYMDGEMADAVARRFTVQFAATRAVLRKYSFNNCPDPQREDIEAMLDELWDAQEDTGKDGEEFDLGDLT